MISFSLVVVVGRGDHISLKLVVMVGRGEVTSDVSGECPVYLPRSGRNRIRLSNENFSFHIGSVLYLFRV